MGKGMLTAAVAGDVFASPPTEAVLAAIRTVTHSAGVLVIIKNYTGGACAPRPQQQDLGGPPALPSSSTSSNEKHAEPCADPCTMLMEGYTWLAIRQNEGENLHLTARSLTICCTNQPMQARRTVMCAGCGKVP